MTWTLHETARRLDRYRQLEQGLFEVVGGWMVDEADAEARILFGAEAQHHAWHAQVWEGLLPRTHDLDGPSTAPGIEAALGALRSCAGTVERLVVLHQVVLGRLRRSYDEHHRAASSVADGPVRRGLLLVLADLDADLEEGARLLGKGDHGAVTTSAETTLDEAGGLLA